MIMDKILVTGCSGFIGSALVTHLSSKGVSGICTLRQKRSRPVPGWQDILVGDINDETDWSTAIVNVDVVIHLAAHVHIMKETEQDLNNLYRSINVNGTEQLAKQAAAAGVRRFVFLSSVKVNGESTDGRGPFVETEKPCPIDPYGISKLEAEQVLLEISKKTGMEVVIIRPPLVYGPGVKANYLTMMYWLGKGLPLPFGAIHNRRSLIALDNLVDLITTCIDHIAAANEIFLVSDGEDLSTTDLLRRMAIAMDKPTRLITVPQGILKLGMKLLGKADLAQRLCGSLQVNISKTHDVLGWNPPFTVDEALRKTALDYLARQ